MKMSRRGPWWGNGKILAKYAGDDSEEREAERRRLARIKMANYAQASRKAVLKNAVRKLRGASH